MNRPFRIVLVCVMAASLAACMTISATPHLPDLIWRTPDATAGTAPPAEPQPEAV